MNDQEFTPDELAAAKIALARENQKLSVPARWGKLTPKERSEEMRRIIMIRWNQHRKKRGPKSPPPP